MEGIPELWLKFESSCVKAKLGVEWPSLTIQATLNGWLVREVSPSLLYRWVRMNVSHHGGDYGVTMRVYVLHHGGGHGVRAWCPGCGYWWP